MRKGKQGKADALSLLQNAFDLCAALYGHVNRFPRAYRSLLGHDLLRARLLHARIGGAAHARGPDSRRQLEQWHECRRFCPEREQRSGECEQQHRVSLRPIVIASDPEPEERQLPGLYGDSARPGSR